MTIGVISDIHNNLPALDAMLSRMEGCDAIFCCGDIIGIGPHPEETVQRIMRIPDLICVRGNHDRYLSEGLPATIPNEEHMEEGEMGMHRWEHARLSDASAAFLRSLPCRTDAVIGGVRIAMMHYCMDDTGKYVNFTPHPSGDDLDRIFADTDADIILYGHDHAPCVQRTAKALYINPGSLGCPARDGNIARGGVLHLDGGSARFEPLRVVYDSSSVVTDIRLAAYPSHAEVLKYFFGIAQ